MKIIFLAKWPFLLSVMITVTVCSIIVTGNSNRSYVAEQSEPLAYQKPKTEVSIVGEDFYINRKSTFKGREWKGYRIEGLLPNLFSMLPQSS